MKFLKDNRSLRNSLSRCKHVERSSQKSKRENLQYLMFALEWVTERDFSVFDQKCTTNTKSSISNLEMILSYFFTKKNSSRVLAVRVYTLRSYRFTLKSWKHAVAMNDPAVYSNCAQVLIPSKSWSHSFHVGIIRIQTLSFLVMFLEQFCVIAVMLLGEQKRSNNPLWKTCSESYHKREIIFTSTVPFTIVPKIAVWTRSKLLDI